MRLMPMVMSLAPHMKAGGASWGARLVASHFVAITSWVYTIERLDHIPRDRLLAFYFGLSLPLTTLVTLIAGTMHVLAATLPPLLVAAIYFMTPLYFAMSLLKTARSAADRLALPIGFLLGPALAPLVPQVSTLLAGVGGGLLAYALGRIFERRRVLR